MIDTRTQRMRDLLEDFGTLLAEIVEESKYQAGNVIAERRMTLTSMKRELSALIANNERLEKL